MTTNGSEVEVYVPGGLKVLFRRVSKLFAVGLVLCVSAWAVTPKVWAYYRDEMEERREFHATSEAIRHIAEVQVTQTQADQRRHENDERERWAALMWRVERLESVLLRVPHDEETIRIADETAKRLRELTAEARRRR